MLQFPPERFAMTGTATFCHWNAFEFMRKEEAGSWRGVPKDGSEGFESITGFASSNFCHQVLQATAHTSKVPVGFRVRLGGVCTLHRQLHPPWPAFRKQYSAGADERMRGQSG